MKCEMGTEACTFISSPYRWLQIGTAYSDIEKKSCFKMSSCKPSLEHVRRYNGGEVKSERDVVD